MIDEGPGPDDLRRFGDDTAYCPECGAEIYDQAEICPDCGAYLTRGPISRPPVEDWFRRRWILLIVIVVIVAFLMLVI
jgi:hypothetical protein